MRVQTDETRASVITFAPKKGYPDASMVGADDGHGIVALVQKAADLAKTDCNRAMDLAHRLSSELRAAEERAREFEAQANYFRDRAAHAEEWLVRIRREVQETFFEAKEQRQRDFRSDIGRVSGIRSALQISVSTPYSISTMKMPRHCVSCITA